MVWSQDLSLYSWRVGDGGVSSASQCLLYEALSESDDCNLGSDAREQKLLVSCGGDSSRLVGGAGSCGLGVCKDRTVPGGGCCTFQTFIGGLAVW